MFKDQFASTVVFPKYISSSTTAALLGFEAMPTISPHPAGCSRVVGERASERMRDWRLPEQLDCSRPKGIMIGNRPPDHRQSVNV